MTTLEHPAHETAGLAESEFADPELGGLADVIDLDRYPIHEPQTESWNGVVDLVRGQLETDGCATLRDFLTPDALDAVRFEIAAIATHVPIRTHGSTVYHRTELERELPPTDPRCVELEWRAGHVTRDMIPPYSPLHRLYASGIFKHFVAACVGQERVFEYADPLAGLVATITPPSGRYPWHYDTNEFVLTIMTQAPDSGGTFEYCKDLRSPGDENLEGLGKVLVDGDRSGVRTVQMRPGDFQLFLGRYSLHRVTDVTGTTARHVAVLSYSDRPGVIGPVDRTRSVYGRVTEAHLVAEAARFASGDGLIL